MPNRRPVSHTTPRAGVPAVATRTRLCFGLLLLAITTAGPAMSAAQQSLSPLSPSGQTITPAFEGWYRNADGTYSLSFGYFNRNGAEQVEVPVGEDNFIAPGAQNQGQPTHFDPRRHYGVFAVVVPANFGEKKLVWTLNFRGQSYAIPGSLRPEWEIDAIQGEASADNTPPRLLPGGASAFGNGPLGITVGPMTVAVGKPLTLTVQVEDDGRAEPVARSASPVDITWFKHQGSGAVKFAPATVRLTPTGGTASTSAVFSEAGDYLIRIRANDGAVGSAGHAQCCWSNAFVRVTVTP